MRPKNRTSATWPCLLALLAGCSGTVEGQAPGPWMEEDPGVPGNPGNPADSATGGSGNTGTPGSPSNPTDPTDPGDPSTPTDPGNPTDPADPADPADPTDPEAPATCVDDGLLHVGTAPMRRLSSTEYRNTLGSLFPGQNPELPELPTEAPVDSFDNDARALGPSDVAASRWEEIAFRYTSELTADPALLDAFLPCAGDVADAASGQACAEMIDAFGLQSQRRPLGTEERARYQDLFDAQLAAIDFPAAVQLTLMAMLQSPRFLYRVETEGADGADGAVTLDAWEMASRLSYFLWQRPPDAELFDAAQSGTLNDAVEIERQVRRMLATPEARSAVADFHRQWLFFDRILNEEHTTRLPELFPAWSAETPASAREELLRFVEHSVFDGAGTLSDLFLSRETEVDARLAEIYGVAGPSEPGAWAAVTLPENQRAGLLTRVGFLAAHAHSANGSPPLRGSYVMQRLFCLGIEPPPPGADTTPPNPVGSALTNREQFEERTSGIDCYGCHAGLNGFGFGFEHYDAIGAYRDMDNGQPVNAVTTLVGTDVNGDVDGAIELSQRVAQSQQVAECAVSRWLRYARGRGIEAEDGCILERLNQAFQASGGNFIELMVDIATSPEFRHRPLGEE